MLLACTLLYLVFRLPWLRSIPAYTFDEGLLALPAKNWIEFGDPLFGQNLDFLRFPLFTLLLTAVYALFGHTILVSRLVSIAAGLASMLLLAKAGRRVVGESVTKWAVFLFSVDFVLVRYQRYGLAESLQILLLLGAFAVWLHPRTRRSLLAAAVLSAALLHKPTSLQILPVLLWLDYKQASSWSLRSPNSIPTSVGQMAATYLVAITMVAGVHLALWSAWPQDFTKAWHMYVVGHVQVNDLPRTMGILLVGSPLAALGSIASVHPRVRRNNNGIAILQVWLAGGFLFLLAMKIHPTRYFSTLLPPALLLAGASLDTFVGILRGRAPRRIAEGAVAILASCIALYSSLLFTANYFLRGSRDSSAYEVGCWLREKASKASVVLGPPHVGVDICNPFLDMTSVGLLKISRNELYRHEVEYVVYDDTEWRSLSDRLRLGVEDSLRLTCDLVAEFRTVDIWKVVVESRCGESAKDNKGIEPSGSQGIKDP